MEFRAFGLCLMTVIAGVGKGRAMAQMQIPLTEQAFQKQVTDLAEYNGWLWMHVNRMGDPSGYWRTPVTGPLGRGWPDLVLVRGTQLIFVELKRQKMMLSSAQRDVLDTLMRVTETYVWRPLDWNQIVSVLARTQVTSPNGRVGSGTEIDHLRQLVRDGEHVYPEAVENALQEAATPPAVPPTLDVERLERILRASIPGQRGVISPRFLAEHIISRLSQPSPSTAGGPVTPSVGGNND